MEPTPPATPEQLMTPDDLAGALDLADAADGVLPRFLCEQRPLRTDCEIAAAERDARGAAALAKSEAGEALTDDEFADECYHLDPVSNAKRRRRPR